MSKTVQLTKNFALSEFERSDTARSLGLDNTIPESLHKNVQRLAETLQKLRDALGQRVIISSGYRGDALNRAVGGVSTSAHSQGLAADISVPGMTPEQLFRKIIELDLDYDQVIQEFGQWVHIGLSADKPRKQKLYAKRNSAGKTVYNFA